MFIVLMFCVNLMVLFISMYFSNISTQICINEKSDQVKLINSSSKSINGVDEYHLAEIFCIGVAEGDTNYSFSRIVDFDVDKTGFIYILDYGKKLIQKYSPSGKYILTIKPDVENGKTFKNPVAIALNNQGHLIVGDEGNLWVQIFNQQGEFKRKFRIQCEFLTDLLIDSKDNIVLVDSYIQFETGNRGTRFQLYDRNGNFLYTICDKTISQKIQIDNPILFGGVIDSYDSLYIANFISTSDYQIEMYDLQGNLLSKIKQIASKISYTLKEKENWKKHKMRIFGESRYQKLIQLFQPPDYKPLISGLYNINENTIWVKTIVNHQNKNTIFLEFDKEGRFVRKIIFIGAHLYRPIFSENRIYDSTAPFEEIQQVKVYTFKKYDR